LITGGLGIALSTDAVSSTNGGACTIAGGLAVARQLFVGTSVTANTCSVTASTSSTSSSSGAVVLGSGGLGIGNTTDSTSSTNGGAATIAGGLAVAKRIYIGTTRSDTPSAVGNALNVPAVTFTDSNTSGGGTITNWYSSYFGKPTLAASNSTVTTTTAATVYIDGSPIQGTNETITNNFALLVNSGTAKVQDKLLVGASTLDADSTAGTVSINTVDITPSAGDIAAERSFSAANNQGAAANVTGFSFANATVRSFRAIVSVSIDSTNPAYEIFHLLGIQRAAAWTLSSTRAGDNSGITFSITTAGQIQYTSGNRAGFVSNTMKFRATTTTV
jgi:hypothetical protein